MSESEKLVENFMIKQPNNNKIENIIEKSVDLDKKKYEKEISYKLSESKEEEVDEDSKHNSEDYNENENKRMVLRNKKKMNYWKDDGEDDDDEDFYREEDDSQYVTKRRTRQSGNVSTLSINFQFNYFDHFGIKKRITQKGILLFFF